MSNTATSKLTNTPILFAGTPGFAADHLQTLIDCDANILAVITQPDKPAKRGKKLQMSPVKVLARKHQLPVLQPHRLRVSDIENFKAQVMVVVAYGQILKPDVISVPRHGCINVHASALPRWRGAAPIQRAIQSEDRETGITVIRIDEGLDTGDMLALETMAISAEDTAATLETRLSKLGQKLLVKVLNNLESCLAAAQPQNDSSATYANKISKAEARIDWSWNADRIAANIRAFNPDPVAYCYKDELRIRIWEAIAEMENIGDTGNTGNIARQDAFKPGQIIKLVRDGLTVACGTGTLQITCLQLPLGKGKPLSATDILNARADLFQSGSFLS